MSAFQHNPEHLRALVGAWIAFRGHAHFEIGGVALDPSDRADWQRAFDELARANAVSVGYRYRETVEPVAGRVTARDAAIPVRGVPAIVRLLKAIDSFAYQSCEHPDWKGSAVEKFCNSLRHALIHALPGWSESDGWAIRDEPNPENVIRL